MTRSQPLKCHSAGVLGEGLATGTSGSQLLNSCSLPVQGVPLPGAGGAGVSQAGKASRQTQWLWVKGQGWADARVGRKEHAKGVGGREANGTVQGRKPRRAVLRLCTFPPSPSGWQGRALSGLPQVPFSTTWVSRAPGRRAVGTAQRPASVAVPRTLGKAAAASGLDEHPRSRGRASRTDFWVQLRGHARDPGLGAPRPPHQSGEVPALPDRDAGHLRALLVLADTSYRDGEGVLR